MAKAGKSLLRICILLGLGAAAAPAEAGTISLTEINLGWFGTNGDPSGGPETRTASVRQYLGDQGLLADVMIFEEIVDVDLLRHDVLADRYQCHSYTRGGTHQHVVVCHKPSFTFDIAPDDDDYVVESVNTTGNLRPAVHGILKSSDGNTEYLHVFGLHLKAMLNKSSVRLEQVQKLVDYIGAEDRGVPSIVMGDFNTFASDPESIQEKFATVGMTELATPEPFTWASATEDFEPAKFDRVWMSGGLVRAVTSAHVVGPCNSDDEAAIAAYNKAVSDHCAVHVVVRY